MNYTPKQLQPLIILSMSMLLSMVSGTTVAHFIIKLFGFWSFTAASLVFPWSFVMNVLLAECYHRKISFFVFLTAITLSLLFGFIAKGVIPISVPFVVWGTIASIISFAANTLIVTYHPPKKHYPFTIRYFLSTGIGELLLVTIVTFGVFLPHYAFFTVFQIWAFSYFTKIIFTFLLAFPTKVAGNFFIRYYELR